MLAPVGALVIGSILMVGGILLASVIYAAMAQGGRNENIQ